MNDVNETVKKLKEMNWEEMYEKDNERLEAVHPPFEDMVKNIEYRFEWCLKQIQQFNVRKDIRILNIGSSLGLLEYFLKKDGYNNIYGVDVDDKTIERCNKNVSGVTFKKGYIEQLPFRDNTFDVVIATQVIEHIKEPHKALLEMKRVLNDKGIMLVTVPKENMLLDKMHLHEFDLYDVFNLFNKIGDKFVIREIHKWDKTKVYTEPNVLAVVYNNESE